MNHRKNVNDSDRTGGTVINRRTVRRKNPARKKTISANQKVVRKIDKGILVPLLLLTGIGLLMVFSANMYTSVVEGSGYMVFIKQLIFVGLGFLVLWSVSKINYHFFDQMTLAYILMGISIILLILVLLIGTEMNGAKRWISLGFTTLQPSELAKAAGCIYMAATISHYPEVTCEAKALFLRCILPLAILCGLTIIEPSMSASIAIAVPMIAILFIAVKSIKLLLPYFILAAGGMVGFIILEPWRLQRLATLFGKGTLDYQISQSLLAIGSGGILGKGLGNGVQKYLFLPELENDFIFANIGEEFGLWGCLLVIVLFVLLITRGMKHAMRADDTFGFYYTMGFMILLGFQVIMNIGVAVSVIPVTGMVLPFVSSGGSSMLVLFGMMGPVLNLTRQTGFKTGFLERVMRK